MEGCIFCKIAKREVPSYKVYEDENFFGFLDIHPSSRGHTLLIPKKHYTWVHDVPQFGQYWETALKIKKAIEKALSPKWVQYVTHGVIPHAHIHIIPRYDSVNHPNTPTVLKSGGATISEKELKEIAEKIQKAV